jgi:uncharacterized protein
MPATTPPGSGSGSGSGSRLRLPEFDVVRALVLIGVFTMNYVVFWNVSNIRRTGWFGQPESRAVLKVFDPWTGPMSTRFAATMAMVAGMGVALGAAKAVRSGDREVIVEQRWRLRRRGVLFILIGVMFDAAWPANILLYMGTYFIFASFAIAWSRWQLVGSAVAVMVLTVIERILVFQFVKVEPLTGSSWWAGSNTTSGGRVPTGTPRGYLSAIVSWGAHPVLPWMAFVLIGMFLAQELVTGADIGVPSARRRLTLIGIGVALVILGYGVSWIGRRWLDDRWRWLVSTNPGGFSRVPPFGLAMPAYVISTIGSSMVFIVGVSWMARRGARFLPVRVLARGGQMTFTLYLLHGLIPWFLTHYGFIVPGVRLYGCLAIAWGGWAVAIVLAALAHRQWKIGPMEWLLRRIGG